MFNCSTNCLCPIRSSQLTATLPFSMRTSSIHGLQKGKFQKATNNENYKEF